MPSSTLLGEATYTLIAQQLADVGITAEYTDPGNNFIADLLAPKFPASFMALEQNPDWQLIQFMIAPNAVFNPFHYEDPKVNEYIEQIQNGDEATQAAVAKELNTYIVEQAWFAPFYRVQGSFATDADHERRDAPDERLPGDLRHPAQGLSRLPARPGSPGRAGPQRAQPVPFFRHVNGDPHASIRAATPGIRRRPRVRDLVARVHAPLPRRRRHRPPHPRPERHAGDASPRRPRSSASTSRSSPSTGTG